MSLIPYFVSGSGDYCGPGTYCGAGAYEPTPCEAGFYCPYAMMTEADSTLPCRAGYYCADGASSATPPPQEGVDDSEKTGGLCPAGLYCAEGSSRGTDCPLGTFLGAEGASTVDDCLSCTAGSYCGDLGLAEPTDLCAEGYYCGTGETEAEPLAGECPPGYACPAGSISPS